MNAMRVKIKMQNGNPCKWIKRSEEARNNQHLIWLVPKEKASILQIYSLNDFKHISEVLNDKIDIIEVM